MIKDEKNMGLFPGNGNTFNVKTYFNGEDVTQLEEKLMSLRRNDFTVRDLECAMPEASAVERMDLDGSIDEAQERVKDYELIHVWYTCICCGVMGNQLLPNSYQKS